MDDHPRSRVMWWRAAGWVLSLAAIGVVAAWLWSVDRTVWVSLWQIDRVGLLGSLAVFQLWFLLRYLGWEWISRQYGSQAERAGNLKMWTLSELARYVPGNIWSFAARYRGTRTSGADRGQAVAALVVEAVCLVGGAALVIAASSQVFFGLTPWWIVAGALIVIPVGFAGVRLLARRMPALRPLSSLRWMHVLGLLSWYAVVWAVFGLANALLIGSFTDLESQSTPLFYGAASVLAWLVGYLSIITPMGLGVREITLVKLLGGSSTTAVASVIALVTRVWLVVSELVFLGLVMVWSSRRRS